MATINGLQPDNPVENCYSVEELAIFLATQTSSSLADSLFKPAMEMSFWLDLHS